MHKITEAECERCKDSGVIARFSRTGGYKCAGPVPDNARGCYEDLCDCPEGQKARQEERRGVAPGVDPKTGEYSTAQMLRDEMFGGDTSQPLFD